MAWLRRCSLAAVLLPVLPCAWPLFCAAFNFSSGLWYGVPRIIVSGIVSPSTTPVNPRHRGGLLVFWDNVFDVLCHLTPAVSRCTRRTGSNANAAKAPSGVAKMVEVGGENEGDGFQV
uniref:Uncharacterized protein n=1 Tax=Leersia perrieri TaxID=77586 RepID=A0A0D9VK78_9ORYZ